MPAPVIPDAKRSPTLLTVLFWIGVGLAPVAALILLVADGNGPLRFAAVLAILAVVLIGLSIALRADGDGGQGRTEELLEEIDQLRRELRGEIVAAAQRGNQALDQAQRAQEAVAAMRRRLDATGAALAGVEEPAGGGRARVTPAEPAGRNRADQDEGPRWDRSEWQDEEEPAPRSQPSRHGADRPAAGHHGGERPSAGVYGGERAGSGVYGGERAGSGAYGGERAGSGVYGGERSAGQSGVYGGERGGPSGVYGSRSGEPEGRPAPEPGHRQMGMVRHTETVHVTTRHTIVDGGSAEPGGGRYGGGYGSWSPPADERSWGAGRPDEQSWSGTGGGPEERSWSGYGGPEERSWSGSGDQWSEQRGDAGEPDWDAPEQARRARPDDTGEYWAQLRTGDRWAAVRDDDRGRELRVGERRAEVHADAGGTEYRVADRWASVRREEPRHDPDRGGDEGWRGGWAEPDDRPALPAGGVPVPDEWRPPRQRSRESSEPERVGRRSRAEEERYGYPPQDDVPRAGGTRWR